MVAGDLGNQVPRRRVEGGPVGGWATGHNARRGLARPDPRQYVRWLPVNFFASSVRTRSREWNFVKSVAYHWGTSRVGRDERQSETALQPLTDRPEISMIKGCRGNVTASKI